MFTGSMFMVPGQELREFEVSRPNMRETERGRESIDGYIFIGKINAILAAAKPEEIERWRQLEHPITHKIIQQRSPGFDILPGDIFKRAGRCFYNQALPYNVGDLGHWNIYYCEERPDIQ